MAGLFGALAAGIARKAQTLDFLPGFMTGPESKSGVSVTWSNALQVTAMLACCKVVAEGIAQVGCRLSKPRATGTGADLQRGHVLWRLLFRRPNPWQTAFEFWETIVFHVMLVGNAYVFINRSASGARILELIILEPGKVAVTRLADMSLVYDVTGADNVRKRLTADVVWHIRGPSWNGWMGMETVRLAREALGLALALEGAHARQHKDGIEPAGVYSIDGNLAPEKFKELSDWIKKTVKAGDPFILDRGAKWITQQMSGVDAQHVEVRRLQVEEVCRSVRVMPIMVGLADKVATYASAEQMFLAHVIHCLMPWAERLEQSAEVALLTEEEQTAGLFFKFNLNALMRGDYKSRQEGLQIQRRNGVINANDWRGFEDMNPRDDEGGDQYIVEANMAVQDGGPLTPTKIVLT